MLGLTDPAYEQEAERIRNSARSVSDNNQDGIRWTVFRDPDGNKFRLSAPRPTQ